MFKVKNIGDKKFEFEGVSLDIGQESNSLDLYTFQRLMVLYYPRVLVPIEESVKEAVAELAGEAIEEVSSPTPEVQQVSASEYPCKTCGKSFNKEKGLAMHERVAHKK